MSIIFIGDSITSSWPLSNYWSGTVNKGVSGDASYQVKARFLAQAVEPNPSAIVLLCGTNNIGSGAVADIVAMAAMARSSGVRCVTCLIPPSIRSGVYAMNGELVLALRDGGFAPPVDYYDAMRHGDGSQVKEWFADGVHPNTAGYDVMAAALAPRLE